MLLTSIPGNFTEPRFAESPRISGSSRGRGFHAISPIFSSTIPHRIRRVREPEFYGQRLVWASGPLWSASLNLICTPEGQTGLVDSSRGHHNRFDKLLTSQCNPTDAIAFKIVKRAILGQEKEHKLWTHKSGRTKRVSTKGVSIIWAISGNFP